jgi:hypothetical protein
VSLPSFYAQNRSSFFSSTPPGTKKTATLATAFLLFVSPSVTQQQQQQNSRMCNDVGECSRGCAFYSVMGFLFTVSSVVNGRSRVLLSPYKLYGVPTTATWQKWPCYNTYIPAAAAWFVLFCGKPHTHTQHVSYVCIVLPFVLLRLSFVMVLFHCLFCYCCFSLLFSHCLFGSIRFYVSI